MDLVLLITVGGIARKENDRESKRTGDTVKKQTSRYLITLQCKCVDWTMIWYFQYEAGFPLL